MQIGGTTYFYTPDNNAGQGQGGGSGYNGGGGDQNNYYPPPPGGPPPPPGPPDGFYPPQEFSRFVDAPPQPQHVPPRHGGFPQGRNGATPYRTAGSYNMADNLRANLQRRIELTQPSIEGVTRQQGPARVCGQFHTLSNLEAVKGSKRDPVGKSRAAAAFADIQSQTYKCTNQARGCVCVLRRITAPTDIPLDHAAPLLQHWTTFKHPAVVPLRGVYPTNDWNTNGPPETVFEYDYLPGAVTLDQAHLLPSTHSNASESDMWHTICTLIGAIRAVHEAGYACRSITPTKVLVSPGRKLHLNCVGMLDIINPGSTQGLHLEQLQSEDLAALGEILLYISCHSKTASFDMLKGTNYSPALKQFIVYLCTTTPITVYDCFPHLPNHLMLEVGNLTSYTEMLEAELQKELHNGRLFRLVCKLGFINERPGMEYDQQWSETGDRYILKLFRDYLFHQQTDKGSPRIDWGHVLVTLNKLDAGSEEKLALESRDHSNLLIVSFRDVKRLIDESFMALLRASETGASEQNMNMGMAMGMMGMGNM
eukprot:TRINITY_DN35462_c0_g1_i1.p1 TRINITY_DN35462_c0_g1~~TRINITY_DN35462_c0_g1_i1.p1  ORF type:complete len:537 (+),score=26.64 TRINITY_DN35462_c0_g1_i1:122-1732(+)